MKESIKQIRPYLRGLPLIILFMVIAVLIAKKYLSYATPLYESTAKLKLADFTQGVPNSNLFKDLDVFTSRNKIAAEIELMKSFALVSQATSKLHFDEELYRVGKIINQELYLDAPIIVTPLNLEAYLDEKIDIEVLSETDFQIATLGVSPMSGHFGDTLFFKNGSILIQKNTLLLSEKPNTDLVGSYQFIKLSSDRLQEKIKKNIDVIPVDDDVPVISIIYRSPVPQKSADFVNQLAQTYIEDYIESKFKAAETTANFLDERISEVTTDLTKSEDRIETYKNGRRIVDLHQESETDLRKIAQLKIQLSNIKISLDAMKELEDNLRGESTDFLLKAPNFQTYTDLLSTELIKRLKTLQSERRDLLITFTPSDERVKVIDGKIDDLKVYLIEGVTNSTKNQKTKLEQLKLEIAEAERFFDGYATKQKDLHSLDRDFNLYETSYNFLNEKRIEAEIAKAAKISFHRIITPAVAAQKPASPNSIIITIVSALVAFLLAIGLIYLFQKARGTVGDDSAIESNCSIPIAIKTPFLVTEEDKKRHFLREAIQLELKNIAYKDALICISSYSNDEGRQLHTRELAQAFAAQGKKVLVLDMQNLLPSIEVDHKAMHQPEYRMFSKETFEAEIKNLGKGYDLVFIDNEQMKDEQIGLLLMSLADQNLFVIDSLKTPARKLEELDLLREEFELPNIYFVLNRHNYTPSFRYTLKVAASKALKIGSRTKK